MHLTGRKLILIAATAVACLGSVAANAQRYGDRMDTRDEVNQTFHDSKDFRHYFEHNFRSYGHEPQWDMMDSSGHVDHAGRNGRMTLKDAIQNMDEDIERLRAEFAHHGPSFAAKNLADEIRAHADQVDARMPHVGDWYRNNADRSWRWDRSELFNRWTDLRRDIRAMTRDLLDRR